MNKISIQARLFFKKFMWNIIYLISYKSLVFMDEDLIYKEFIHEILKTKKNDSNVKWIINQSNAKDGKDITVNL